MELVTCTGTVERRLRRRQEHAARVARGGWCAPVAVGCRVVPGEYERRRRLEVEIEARKDHRPRAADRYINRPKDPKSHVP